MGKPLNIRIAKNVPVYCVENSTMYNSLKHAACTLHIDYDSLRKAVCQGRKIEGYTFEKFQPSKHRGKSPQLFYKVG